MQPLTEGCAFVLCDFYGKLCKPKGSLLVWRQRATRFCSAFSRWSLITKMVYCAIVSADIAKVIQNYVKKVPLIARKSECKLSGSPSKLQRT